MERLVFGAMTRRSIRSWPHGSSAVRSRVRGHSGAAIDPVGESGWQKLIRVAFCGDGGVSSVG
jgi:hypothetical protein